MIGYNPGDGGMSTDDELRNRMPGDLDPGAGGKTGGGGFSITTVNDNAPSPEGEVSITNSPGDNGPMPDGQEVATTGFIEGAVRSFDDWLQGVIGVSLIDIGNGSILIAGFLALAGIIATGATLMVGFNLFAGSGFDAVDNVVSQF